MAPSEAARNSTEETNVHQMPAFSWQPHKLLDDTRLTWCAKYTYVLLSRFSLTTKRKVWPSAATAAARGGVSRDTVLRGLRELERFGWVKRVRAKWHAPSVYLLGSAGDKIEMDMIDQIELDGLDAVSIQPRLGAVGIQQNAVGIQPNAVGTGLYADSNSRKKRDKEEQRKEIEEKTRADARCCPTDQTKITKQERDGAKMVQAKNPRMPPDQLAMVIDHASKKLGFRYDSRSAFGRAVCTKAHARWREDPNCYPRLISAINAAAEQMRRGDKFLMLKNPIWVFGKGMEVLLAKPGRGGNGDGRKEEFTSTIGLINKGELAASKRRES